MDNKDSKIISIDARSFAEIWAKLTDDERSELRFNLIRDCDVTLEKTRACDPSR